MSVTTPTPASPTPASPTPASVPPSATRAATPVAAPRLTQRRRSPKLIALAVALVAVGALVAAYAVTLVGSTGQYLAVARAVPAGAQLTGDDLTVVRISSDPALRPIRARDAEDVVGQRAAMDLVPGTLLTSDHLVADEPLLGPDTSRVSIGVRRDRQSTDHLRPGAAVTLVAVPSGSSINQDEGSLDDLRTYDGTVVAVTTPETRGGADVVLVDVAVADGDAHAVAALAANNRMAIVARGG